jgi:hypothetical protein
VIFDSYLKIKDKSIENNTRNMTDGILKKRMPGKKVRMSDMVGSKYFPGNKDEMKPSYIITPLGQKISRVNSVGTVTDKFVNEDESYASLTVDDGTGAIRVKAFKEGVGLLKNFDVGDMLMVIGKMKEYSGETYVNAEIVKEVEDVNYDNMRKMEILKELIEQKKIVSDIRGFIEQMSYEELVQYVRNKFDLDEESLQTIVENLKISKEVDYKPKILEVINLLDKGDGVEIGKLLQISDLPENVIEKTIEEMLVAGMLFEPIVGKLKKV